jgi:hypothetical protein
MRPPRSVSGGPGDGVGMSVADGAGDGATSADGLAVAVGVGATVGSGALSSAGRHATKRRIPIAAALRRGIRPDIGRA